MKYIIINDDLTIEIVRKCPETGFVISGRHIDYTRELPPIGHLVYMHILYPAVYARDRRNGITNRSYKLIEPDPWMISVAYLMWQGIVQGLTWDLVKLAVQQALNTLSASRLAPVLENAETIKKKSTRIGFHWTEYATSGRKRAELFIGLKREYEKMSVQQRHYVTGIDKRKE